jgi:hypothetical protein
MKFPNILRTERFITKFTEVRHPNFPVFFQEHFLFVVVDYVPGKRSIFKQDISFPSSQSLSIRNILLEMV